MQLSIDEVECRLMQSNSGRKFMASVIHTGLAVPVVRANNSTVPDNIPFDTNLKPQHNAEIDSKSMRAQTHQTFLKSNQKPQAISKQHMRNERVHGNSSHFRFRISHSDASPKRHQDRKQAAQRRSMDSHKASLPNQSRKQIPSHKTSGFLAKEATPTQISNNRNRPKSATRKTAILDSFTVPVDPRRRLSSVHNDKLCHDTDTVRKRSVKPASNQQLVESRPVLRTRNQVEDQLLHISSTWKNNQFVVRPSFKNLAANGTTSLSAVQEKQKAKIQPANKYSKREIQEIMREQKRRRAVSKRHYYCRSSREDYIFNIFHYYHFIYLLLQA